MLRQACESEIMSCSAEVAAATFLPICRSLRKSPGNISKVSAHLKIIAQGPRQTQHDFCLSANHCTAPRQLLQHFLSYAGTSFCSDAFTGIFRAGRAYQPMCPGAGPEFLSMQAPALVAMPQKWTAHAGHRFLPLRPLPVSIACLPLLTSDALQGSRDSRACTCNVSQLTKNSCCGPA